MGERMHRLAGRNIALIFETASTRTRSAFEVAAHDEGAHVSCLGPGESGLGTRETARDVARVLGRMFDGRPAWAGRSTASAGWTPWRSPTRFRITRLHRLRPGREQTAHHHGAHGRHPRRPAMRVVIALGGNALLQRGERPRLPHREWHAARAVAALARCCTSTTWSSRTETGRRPGVGAGQRQRPGAVPPLPVRSRAAPPGLPRIPLGSVAHLPAARGIQPPLPRVLGPLRGGGRTPIVAW